MRRQLDPARLAREELLELRLWMDDVRTEAGIRWCDRRWKAMEIADAVLFELERLRERRLARGLIATALLAAGVATAALTGGSGSHESAGSSQAAAVRPAAPAQAPAPVVHPATHVVAKPNHRRVHHAAARHPKRRHHKASVVTPVAAHTPPPAPRPVSPPRAPAPAPHRAPATTHHTGGGGGQAVQFDNSG